MADRTRVSGSCLCGAVRFSVELPSLFCGHCHCTMCQRAHGAGYVTWFAVETSKLTFDSGEERLEHFDSSPHGTRSFCRSCGSSLFCRSTRHPEKVDIVLANMHGPIDRPPQVHVYFDDRAHWVEPADALPKLGGTSGLEARKA